MTSNAIKGIRRKKSSLCEVKVAVIGAPGVGKSGKWIPIKRNFHNKFIIKYNWTFYINANININIIKLKVKVLWIKILTWPERDGIAIRYFFFIHQEIRMQSLYNAILYRTIKLIIN